MSRFALHVDDELDLVLREPWTDSRLHDLAARNLDRLREWEPWAQGEQPLEGTRAYARAPSCSSGWMVPACPPRSACTGRSSAR